MNCNKCNEKKSIDDFYKSRKICKKCVDSAALAKQRTKRGLVSRIYTDQKQVCKKRKHPQPEYMLEELIDFIFSQENFSSLYDNWVASGYNTLLRPSIDRKNDYLTYSLENIQLMTFQENIDKCAIDRISGRNSKKCTSVIQMDLQGIKIREYKSIRQASRDVCSNDTSCGNIHRCCAGKIGTAYGYKWKFNYKGYL